MKILRKIGIALFALAFIYIVLAFIAPSHCRVERSAIINSDAKIVFTNVNTLKKWKQWSYWDNIDKVTMKDSFSGPESGVGAKHWWESKNDSVGKGTLTISKSEENKYIEAELYFDGMGTSMAGWRFADTTGGTKVTASMDMDIPFLGRPFMMFMNMDKMLGGDFEKTLAGLKTLSENEPKTPEIIVEEKDIPAMHVLTITDTVSVTPEIGPMLGKLYMEIGKVATEFKYEQNGAVFCIYHKFDSNMIVMEAGIPIKTKGDKTKGRVKNYSFSGGKAAFTEFKGPYEQTILAHNAINKWAKENGKTLLASPWEVYVNDPGIVKDPNEYLTDIYYFIK